MRFALTDKDLKIALDEIAGRDKDVKKALALVGYPEERRRGGPSYAHLLRIINGQQLSVKAAAAIFAKLEAAMEGEIAPERFLKFTDRQLRALGFSRQKIAYGRGLSEAVLEGRLDPPALKRLPDAEVMEKITALKGFGRWSAEMFLLFSLGRPDVWPVDDLGIQEGLRRLKRLKKRPDPKRAERLGKPWRPYRGAMAIFVWHYYARAPM